MVEDPLCIPNLCYHCLYNVVHRCEYKESDPWRALVFTVQLMMFQYWARREIIGDMPKEEINKKLNDGCLGCKYPKGLMAAIKFVKEKGTHETAKHIRMEEGRKIWYDV